MAIIGISGKKQSGKDTVGRIIQIITDSPHFNDEAVVSFINKPSSSNPEWVINKFANKLKWIVCMLINCTGKQLEDEDFKNTELSEEWWYYKPSDTMYPYLEFKQHEDQNNGINISSEDLIKPTPRTLLQLLGTECGRQVIHTNIWVNATMSDYINTNPNFSLDDGDALPVTLRERYPNWIITDVRFPNEIEAVKQKDGISIRINRPFKCCNMKDLEYQDCMDCAEYQMNIFQNEHISETALDDYGKWNYVINNDGTLLELVQKVREILIKTNTI